MTFTRSHIRTLTALARLLESLTPGPPAAGVVIFYPTGGIAVAETIVDADAGSVGAHVRFLDAHGNETTPDTTPVWASSDETVATVEAGADGSDATVSILGKAGATVIGVETTEQDTGDTIRAEGTLTVRASSTTVSGEVVFDSPTE